MVVVKTTFQTTTPRCRRVPSLITSDKPEIKMAYRFLLSEWDLSINSLRKRKSHLINNTHIMYAEKKEQITERKKQDMLYFSTSNCGSFLTEILVENLGMPGRNSKFYSIDTGPAPRESHGGLPPQSSCLAPELTSLLF